MALHETRPADGPGRTNDEQQPSEPWMKGAMSSWRALVGTRLPAGFARGAAVLLGGRVGFHLLGLVSGVLLARGLGPEGRGEYFGVLLWPTVLGWLATLGVTKATTYFRARHADYERDLMITGLWVALVAGGVFTALGQILLPRLLAGHPEWVGLGRLVLLLVPALALSDMLMGMFDGARQFRLLNCFRLGFPLLQVLGLIALHLTDRLTVKTAVGLNALAVLVTLIVQYAVVAARSGVTLRPPSGLARETLGYAVQFYPALVTELALSSLDQVLLVPLLSPGELGLYVIATRAAIIVDVPQAISQVVFVYMPRMTPAQAFRLAQHAAVAGVIVTGLLGGGLMLAARPVILLLYGSAFEGAVVPFQVLLLGVFAIGIRRILADGLSGLGKPQYSGIGHGVALAVMVLLLWILVPTGGIGGAVWAVAIAHWVNLLVTAGLFWMERKRVLTSGVLSES